MANATSLITLTSGKQVTVEGNLPAVSQKLAEYLEPGAPALWGVEATDGTGWLINVSEIVSVEGTF